MMNERIESLIELAEVWNTDGDVDKCEVDLYKFAQLIIEECVDAVKTTAVMYTKNGEDPATVAIRVDGALGVSAEIARRFGALK